MNLADGKRGGELLQAQVHVWNHIFNFIDSMSLKCAVQLGIPDVIHSHGKPMKLSELIAALPVHPTKACFVHRLMRNVVHSGFFACQNVSESDQEEGYVLTNASQLLLRGMPLSLRPFLLAMLDPVLTKPFHHVSEWFQNDDPNTFHTAYGTTFWEYCGHESRVNHLFNEAMAGDARLIASVLINEFKDVFEGLESLVDVGGGDGSMARALIEAFPHLHFTVLDLPQVVADLQGSDKLKYVGGDMFEAVPPAEAVFLKSILHDWNDENCVKILKQCKEAIKGQKRGKVIIVDVIMENRREDDDKSRETKLNYDMMMMMSLASQERSEKEWATLFLDAGFGEYKITSGLGIRSLIEVTATMGAVLCLLKFVFFYALIFSLKSCVIKGPNAFDSAVLAAPLKVPAPSDPPPPEDNLAPHQFASEFRSPPAPVSP